MLFVLFTYILRRNIFRSKSCNLHCYVCKSFFYSVVYNCCLSFYKNTDTSATVNIRNDASVLLCLFLESTNVQVLTDNCNFLYKSIFYSFGRICIPCLCHKCIHISCIRCNSLSCNSFYILLECIIFSNEICLRVNLYDCCCVVTIHSDTYKTFCSDTSSFFLSFCLSVLS
ncbi:unknown [Roseburia sp. CAG:50]|nr:unknown [Roseburia sp. CAG:50]